MWQETIPEEAMLFKKQKTKTARWLFVVWVGEPDPQKPRGADNIG